MVSPPVHPENPVEMLWYSRATSWIVGTPRWVGMVTDQGPLCEACTVPVTVVLTVPVTGTGLALVFVTTTSFVGLRRWRVLPVASATPP
jgi:hypothetical protein